LQFVLGCAWSGTVAVPINASSRGMQLEHMLVNSGARILVIEASLLPALDAITLENAQLERIWVVDADALPQSKAGIVLEPVPSPGAPVPPVRSGPGDVMTILYTSGTTGMSKGVCCPHAQYFWWGILKGWQLETVKGEDRK